MRPATTAALAIALLLTCAQPLQAQSSVQRNAFGPLDVRCRGACGGDCPDTCERTQYNECQEEGTGILVVTRYVCGTHQGCRDHDDCLDACYAPYEYGDIPFTDLTWADAEFWGAGGCQRDCHEEAWDYAQDQWGSDGPSAVQGWIGGEGPNDGTMIFEYTRDAPDGPENARPCDECEECFQGACLPVEGCEPCNSCKDVHLYTLDGLKYDFQAVGEFILAESDDGSFVVQARHGKYGSRASVNVAVAMRVAGTRVEIGFEGLRIDGDAPGDLPVGETLLLPSGGDVRRLARAWLVRWPGGARVNVRVFTRSMDVGMVLSDDLRGRVRGLLGNFDGDPANDLAIRGGEVLGRPVTFDTLYGPYAASWRIGPEESLFDYPPGLGTADFQLPDYPRQALRVEDLPEADRGWAREICREAGVPPGSAFDDCIYDVALTGDTEFAQGTGRSNAEPVEVLRPTGDPGPPLPPAANVVLEAPRTAVAGERFDVRIGGTSHPADRLLFAARDVAGRVADETAGEIRVRDGVAVTLEAPPDAGTWELLYVRTPDDAILASAPLSVTRPAVALVAPEQVRSGATFEVTVRGELRAGDWIALVAGTAADRATTAARARVPAADGGTVTLSAPTEPGEYEVRYVTDSRPARVRARAAVAVLPRAVTLDAPPRAVAADEIEVRVSGTPRARDWVTVVEPGAPPSRVQGRTRVPAGSPAALTLALPTVPGTYEIRYATEARPRKVLAASPITVVPREIALEAPAEIAADGDLEVRISGNPRANDWLTVVAPDAPAGAVEHRSRVPATEETSAMVRVSTVPGTYELRYVTEASPRQVLARQPLTVVPREVTLDAASRVPASFELAIAVGGQPRRYDFVVVAAPDAPDDERKSYVRIRGDAPGEARVQVPAEPGAYELRYLTEQAPRRVLARRPLTVAEREVALRAPEAVDAGAELAVEVRGDVEDRDRVTVVPVGAGADARAGRGATARLGPQPEDGPAGSRAVRLQAPEEPGRYEIRVVGASPRTVYARMEIEVR